MSILVSETTLKGYITTPRSISTENDLTHFENFVLFGTFVPLPHILIHVTSQKLLYVSPQMISYSLFLYDSYLLIFMAHVTLHYYILYHIIYGYKFQSYGNMLDYKLKLRKTDVQCFLNFISKIFYHYSSILKLRL